MIYFLALKNCTLFASKTSWCKMSYSGNECLFESVYEGVNNYLNVLSNVDEIVLVLSHCMYDGGEIN